MSHVPEHQGHCPSCGEPCTLVIDTDGADTTYIEDYPVCCAPMEVIVRWPEASGTPEVALRPAEG